FEYEINPNHPLQVQFEAVPDPTGIALEYLWSFGDGHSSDLFNPRHEYERPGSYEVCLQVINPVTGCTDVVCKVIVVGGGDCTAFFEAFPSAIDNFTYIFEARDTRDGLIYTWDFGDGHTIEGGGPRERHTYQDPGIYIACLKVEDTLNNCRDQYCQEIFVEVIQDCHADFSWCPDSTGTSPFAIRFKPVIPPIDLGLEYHWTFGDGSTSNEESPVHLFPGPGEYEVCLVVQTPDGSCIDRQCEVIRLGEGICDATFSYTEPASLEITFSANTLDPDLEYFWFFSDSPTLRRGPVVTHRFPHEGHYLVCLTVEGDDCQETYCDTVFVSTGGGNCVANYSYLVEPGGIYHFFNHSTGSTPNAQLTYHWDFGDGTTSTEENPTHGFPNGNNYEVCLTISDATGCTATICQNIGGYTIEGEVFATNSQVFNGIAYLIYHDPIYQTLTAIDSAFVQGSQYAFHGVGPGTYLVKAALLPGSPNYHSFLPTYLGDKLFWHQAISVVIATSDVYLPPINLVPGANPGGPGFIGGLISEGANKQAGDPLANVSVLLLDIDEHAITHTVTNEAGEYSFDNLAWGTYKVFVEIPGKLADPWIITIGPDQPEMTSADFVVEEFTITTGFDKPSFGEVLSLYPNPATNTVYVDLELKTAEKLTLSLISMMGQEVLRQQVQLTAGRHQLKLPVEHIPEGVYLLNIRAKEQLIAIRMIKQ
ncbi:MAG: PKD domain-containing protein, partial [Bacteroidetes bacterium]